MLRDELSPAIPTASAPLAGSPAAASMRQEGASAAYRRGDEIFAQGDRANAVFTLVRGCARLVRTLSDGRRQICAFVMPGQVFGLTTRAEQAFSAEAVDTSIVVRERRDTIESRIGSDPAFAAAMRAAAANDLQNAYDRMVLVCRGPATARVAWFLLTMRDHNATDTFRLPMSRADIADYLGMAFETSSRAFTELKKRKVITQSGMSTVTLLDRDRAASIAESP